MTTLESQLNAKPDIGLDSMDSVALMDRFDDKYLIPYAWLPDVIDALPKFRVLRINDGCMTRYNNLYFDTQDDRCFADHVRGKNKRFKVRIRHYTNTDVAFLEVKLRDVFGKTTKHRVSRNGQDAWDAPLTKEETRFLESHLGQVAEALVPVLQSRFDSFTLADVDSGERVTMDHGLEFVLPQRTFGPAPFPTWWWWSESNVMSTTKGHCFILFEPKSNVGPHSVVPFACRSLCLVVCPRTLSWTRSPTDQGCETFVGPKPLP